MREAVGHLDELFATPAARAAHAELLARAGCRVHDVTEGVLASLADTVTPQGLVGIARLPHAALDDALPLATRPLTVVLVEVADPGNVGTAVRTADAAGAAGVVVTAGSADVRNPKAVRASAGSLFHLPVATGVPFAEVAQACRRRGVAIVGADSRGERRHVEVDLLRPTAVVFGNEAHGLDSGVLAACDVVARVPIHGRAESLNLAATVAVFAYEASRQREAAGWTAVGKVSG